MAQPDGGGEPAGDHDNGGHDGPGAFSVAVAQRLPAVLVSAFVFDGKFDQQDGVIGGGANNIGMPMKMGCPPATS